MAALDDLTLTELAQASVAAPRTRAGPGAGTATGTAPGVGSLYDALLQAHRIVADPERAERALAVADTLETLRGLRDRLPHDQLIERALEATGYRAFLAGAPDAPAGIHNVSKLLRIARRSAAEPLFEFVERLAARVRRADPEEEAPLYSPDDDLVVISTIHKAKGLEWPYVFLAGIDQGLFFKVGGSAAMPMLSPWFGFALPIPIVIRDDDSEVPVPQAAVHWTKHVEDETRKEYAEAKRLFYVACTRARDRLILAGGLERPVCESRLTSTPQWMHKDTPERWLRHLYPPLSEVPGGAPSGGEESEVARDEPQAHEGQEGQQGEEVRDGRSRANGVPDERGRVLYYGRRGRSEPRVPGDAGPDRALIHRGLDALQALDTEPVAGTSPAPVRLPTWPAHPAAALPDPARLAPDPSLVRTLERAMGDVETQAVLRTEFTASELMKYDTCPWMHFFGYRTGISSPTIEAASGDALVNLILPEKRGDILHQYLREHRPDWDEARMRQEMERILLWHIPMDETLASQNALELLAHARRYLKSELHAQVREAQAAGRRVYRELPFVFRLSNDIRIRGVLDLIYDAGPGWRIVDYKTGLFRGHQGAPEEIAQARAPRYRVQSTLYTLGAITALPDEHISDFCFFFTALGVEVSLPVTHAWPAHERDPLIRIVEQIRGRAYGGSPQWERAKCEGCEYLPICRPEGAPQETLARATRRTSMPRTTSPASRAH
jgi:hypothetical protein